MAKKFYVTCAIPYVNAPPHIGHALEFVQGDVIARYHELLGEKTLLLSGGDENALKNVQAAEKAGKNVQEFIDENTRKFYELTKALGCRFDIWQKGSDRTHHFPASQKLWNLCKKDIYKKSYEGLYCVGCETFYTPDELNEQGECFEHPGRKLETVKEENYFFRLKDRQEELITLIESDTLKILPSFRKNEVVSFLKQPLQDISISRSNERAKNWGVPVPGDPSQRMYVWFDALNIYQSGVGFGWDDTLYTTWWPADLHIIGKGITRFHAVYWPAFLLSAGLPLPKSIFAHGYFTVNGQKMSKTLGNVIDPGEFIAKFGADAVRYYLLKEIPPASDGDFSERRFREIYNSDLANGLGNLIARVAKLAEGFTFEPNEKTDTFITEVSTTEGAMPTVYKKLVESYRFDEALKLLWGDIDIMDDAFDDYVGTGVPVRIRSLDQYINQMKPWTLEGEKRKAVLRVAVDVIRYLSTRLAPFMPDTAAAIKKQFAGPTIKSGLLLFPRIQ